MKTPLAFPLAWQLSKSGYVALIVTAWTSLLASSAEPQPGTQLDILSRSPAGEVHLLFRYCPPGQGFRGKPQLLPKVEDSPAAVLQRKKFTVTMKAFYITETEVSQGAYRHVLGQAALDQVNNRAAKFGAPTGDEYPILGLTVDEAASFCRQLQQAAVGDASSVTSLESRGFRLPTHYEWQYACRARQTLDDSLPFPHFSGWCSLKDLPAAQMQDAKDLWKKAGGDGDFTGTQDQIEKILRSVAAAKEADDQAKAIKLLEAFLRAGIGLDRPLTNRGDIHTVDSGKPNAWNIRNMHGNLYEWTIAERDPDKQKQIFQFLAGAHNASAPDTNCFLLADAGYSFSFTRQNLAQWVKFSIWGGEPFDIDKDAPAPLKYGEARDEAFASDRFPGLRVVLDRVLSATWVLAIRKSVTAPQALDDKAHAELNQSRDRITELGASKGELAIVKFYQSLANYRLGRVSDAARDVKAAVADLPDDDSYFRLFGQLAECDAAN